MVSFFKRKGKGMNVNNMLKMMRSFVGLHEWKGERYISIDPRFKVGNHYLITNFGRIFTIKGKEIKELKNKGNYSGSLYSLRGRKVRYKLKELVLYSFNEEALREANREILAVRDIANMEERVETWEDV